MRSAVLSAPAFSTAPPVSSTTTGSCEQARNTAPSISPACAPAAQSRESFCSGVRLKRGAPCASACAHCSSETGLMLPQTASRRPQSGSGAVSRQDSCNSRGSTDAKPAQPASSPVSLRAASRSAICAISRFV